MAIACARSLSELLEECQMVGVVPVPTKNKKNPDGSYTKTHSKDDCINALRQYYIQKRKEEGTYTESLDWMLRNDFQPMLALQLHHSKHQDDIMSSRQWVLQEKIDGCRMLITGLGSLNFYSRNISVTDYLPVDYSDKIVTNVDYSKITHRFVVDSEIVPSYMPEKEVIQELGLIADTQLNLIASMIALNSEDSRRCQETIPFKYMLFDIIEFDGESLINKPLKVRQAYLNIVYKELKEAGLLVEQPQNNFQTKESARDFYARMIREGKEGAVAKDINGKYVISGTRSHDSWVKLKRDSSQALIIEGLGDNIDGFITGYTNQKDSNWSDKRIGAVEVSVYLTDDMDDYILDDEGNPKTHVIANVSNFTMEQAEAISEPDPENPGYMKLKQEIYGKVLTVVGQDISAKSKALTHARIIPQSELNPFRFDKTPDQCKLRQSFIESQVL